MSAGSFFSFAPTPTPIPNADPDDARRLFQRLPFDPTQATGLMRLAAQQAAAQPDAAPAAPAAPPLSFGALHAGGGFGALPLPQATAPEPPASPGRASAPGPAGMVSGLFDPRPMGPPQGFAGTSGTIVPGPDAAPEPPAGPLGMRVRSGAGAAPPAQPATPPADLPAPGARPTIGHVPFGFVPSPTGQPGAGAAPGQPPAQPGAPLGAGPTPAGAQANPVAEEGPSFLGRLGTGIAANSDLLQSIGIGLMTTRGFGPGFAAGLKNHQDSSAKRAATDLARAEFGLKARELAQKTLGNNATVEALISKGYARTDAVNAVLASQAGHREALQNMLNSAFRKTPENFTTNPDGSLTPIPGGPEDLKRKEDVAAATARGTNSEKPETDYNLSPGQTRYSGTTNQPLAAAAPDKPEGFDTEAKLRGEFSKGLGSFQDVHDGYGRVVAATRQREGNPGGVSPASDIALVFGYMKMLDPGSVVREGEYATARNAAGIPDLVRNLYNKAVNGEFLTPDQRQDMVGQATQLYGTARKNAEAIQGRYRNLAGQYGVDPDRTAYLPETPVAPVVGRDRMGRGAAPPAAGGAGAKPGSTPSRSDLEAEARRRGLIQ